MSEEYRDDDVYAEATAWDRVKSAFKVAWIILINRPIIIYYDDGEMYARSNPYYLAAAAKNLNEIATEQAARMTGNLMAKLLETPKHRNN